MPRLACVYRPAYALLVGTAAVMGLLAVTAAIVLDRRMVDPEGFLGPSWLRLPLLILGALLLDLLPRTLWVSRFNPKLMPGIVRERLREHWTRDRLVLTVLGVVCFYVTYVCYRNLKSFLPFIMGDEKFDRELHLIDRVLFFGHEPATVLHTIFGTGFSAHILSSIYLWFLPLVPLALTAWLIWSRNITFGYWFATSQCLAWSLGTASYYALPTLGPGFAYSWLYSDLPETGSGVLMESLFYARKGVLRDGTVGAVQSVAGFASLHVAITLLVALMVQYTLRNRLLQWVFWVNFAVTCVATLYFGWHYVADDIAGVVIALVSFWLGGLASGQKFDRHGLASHPTSTTAKVPVEAD
ncbi:inositol phosphorylceramide synthase [Nocardioides gansuensis]|uniref:Inositol phosphorylceramide synthase n=1 Tax=Nocardioides gansuensis TaxID=2138300 RepID=A0A2T8FA62_9ACTN|nr:inositol phosphorylceramide synthase [Nocardioides gansuensis]